MIDKLKLKVQINSFIRSEFDLPTNKQRQASPPDSSDITLIKPIAHTLNTFGLRKLKLTNIEDQTPKALLIFNNSIAKHQYT